MQILDWIDFGKLSAERDDELSNYFFDNGVLQKVVKSPSSFLVLGRKGAGKTAVFRFLTENKDQFVSPKDVLISLSFEDYNWNVHALLTNENKAGSMLYKQSWRFVILVETVKAWSAWHAANGFKPPKRLSGAMKLLERLFDSPIPNIYQIVGRKLLSLSRLKLPSGGVDLEEGDVDSVTLEAGEISFDQVQQNKGLQEHLAQNIENLIDHLERAVSEATEHWPSVFICFDKVDEAWDDVSFEASKKVIAGLVSASEALTTQYKGKIRPIVFLREDIFDVLSINDANKLREDCGALLHWTKDSLMNLILRRVNYYGAKKEVPPVTEFDSLFDKSEMRQRAKPSNYILRRTMMRPRDLIALLSKTAEAMREKVNDPFAESKPSFEKLECDSIYAAEPGYSDWLRKELLEEWKVQRPEIVQLFQAIQNNGSTNFTRDELAAQLMRLGGDAAAGDVVSYLRFLFDNSIVGFKLGASTEWKFKCFYPSQGFVESDEYHVHEGLTRALNLREPREDRQQQAG